MFDYRFTVAAQLSHLPEHFLLMVPDRERLEASVVSHAPPLYSQGAAAQAAIGACRTARFSVSVSTGATSDRLRHLISTTSASIATTPW